MRWLALAILLVQEPAATTAIKDATIVVAPGTIIEKGVVVMRDGLILDVGPDATIPSGAIVADGKGLTVYAGFIDGRSTLGLPPMRRTPDQMKDIEGAQPDVTREAPPSMEQANRKGIRPELVAAEWINVNEEAAKKALQGGFTVAVISPEDEYLAGRAALLTLSGKARRNALLRGKAPFQASFKSYGEGYPHSGMGVMAHLRQTFLDAAHHAHLWEIWTPGRPRPAVDPALEALQPLLKGEAPLFFEAQTDREILRALDLSKEFGFKLGLTGAREAHRVASLLTDIPVVLSLKLPKEVEAESEALRQERKRLRDLDLDNAKELRAANVPVCFSTLGLGSPSEAFDSIATLVERGLAADEALAALTTTPARVFGLDATHGTIEKGKAAHLVALTAPLGDRDADVRFAFVEGRRFDFEVKPAGKKEKKEEKKGEAPPADDGIPIESEADRHPKTRTGGNVLLRNATILTVTRDGTIENGSILVQSGKIVSIGAPLEAPEGTSVIDATGLTVMPGIVDCHTHIAIDGGLNESTQSVTPEVRVNDMLDPRDVEVYRASAGGVTAANLLHGSGNSIGGQNATVKMKYDLLPREMLFPGAPRGVKFALGENPKQANSAGQRGKRFPNTRMGVEAVFRRAFAEAREYEKLLQRDPSARRDLRLEALVGVLKGDILVHCHGYRADEILMILEVAKEHGFRIATLQHALEGYRVAPEIAAAGAGASTFSDWWAYKIEAYEAIPHNAALMTRAGVVTSINSDLTEQIRHLSVEAAKTMKYGGLSEHEALAQITLNPAVQLGLSRSCGTIAPGKDADLAIFNGHPFSPYSRCVMTLIDGEVVFEAPGVPNRTTPGFAPAKRLRRPPAPLPRPGPVLIRNATLHPVTSAPFRGSLLIQDGKIAALGGISEAPDAVIVDASDLHVYPGMIDASTPLGLREIGSVAATRDETEIGALQPDLKALTAINPHSELIPVTRAAGITAALVRPLASLISGQSAVIRLTGWVPREMAVKEIYALQVEFPLSPEGSEKKDDYDRDVKALREIFEAAKRYDGSVKDPRMEAFQPYFKGERPVVFQAQRARQIRAAVAFAEEFGVRPVISGGRDAWKVAAFLAEKKIPVIIGGTMDRPYEAHDPYDSVFTNAAKLSRAGVEFAISAAEDYHSNARNTPYHAAWAAAYGLDREEALKAVTLYPARILGVGDRMGSLEAGKDADLIVTTGDPLEVVTDIVYLFIAGRAVALDTRHTRNYEKFRERVGPR